MRHIHWLIERFQSLLDHEKRRSLIPTRRHQHQHRGMIDPVEALGAWRSIFELTYSCEPSMMIPFRQRRQILEDVSSYLTSNLPYLRHESTGDVLSIMNDIPSLYFRECPVAQRFVHHYLEEGVKKHFQHVFNTPRNCLLAIAVFASSGLQHMKNIELPDPLATKLVSLPTLIDNVADASLYLKSVLLLSSSSMQRRAATVLPTPIAITDWIKESFPTVVWRTSPSIQPVVDLIGTFDDMQKAPCHCYPINHEYARAILEIIAPVVFGDYLSSRYPMTTLEILVGAVLRYNVLVPIPSDVLSTLLHHPDTDYTLKRMILSSSQYRLTPLKLNTFCAILRHHGIRHLMPYETRLLQPTLKSWGSHISVQSAIVRQSLSLVGRRHRKVTSMVFLHNVEHCDAMTIPWWVKYRAPRHLSTTTCRAIIRAFLADTWYLETSLVIRAWGLLMYRCAATDPTSLQVEEFFEKVHAPGRLQRKVAGWLYLHDVRPQCVLECLQGFQGDDDWLVTLFMINTPSISLQTVKDFLLSSPTKRPRTPFQKAIALLMGTHPVYPTTQVMRWVRRLVTKTCAEGLQYSKCYEHFRSLPYKNHKKQFPQPPVIRQDGPALDCELLMKEPCVSLDVCTALQRIQERYIPILTQTEMLKIVSGAGRLGLWHLLLPHTVMAILKEVLSFGPSSTRDALAVSLAMHLPAGVVDIGRMLSQGQGFNCVLHGVTGWKGALLVFPRLNRSSSRAALLIEKIRAEYGQSELAFLCCMHGSILKGFDKALLSVVQCARPFHTRWSSVLRLMRLWACETQSPTASIHSSAPSPSLYGEVLESVPWMVALSILRIVPALPSSQTLQVLSDQSWVAATYILFRTRKAQCVSSRATATVFLHLSKNRKPNQQQQHEDDHEDHWMTKLALRQRNVLSFLQMATVVPIQNRWKNGRWLAALEQFKTSPHSIGLRGHLASYTPYEEAIKLRQRRFDSTGEFIMRSYVNPSLWPRVQTNEENHSADSQKRQKQFAGRLLHGTSSTQSVWVVALESWTNVRTTK
eukprot:PhF_6_TR921/c0_g1_i1/m.1555